MDNENTSFAEFAEAFDDAADYQTDSAEETTAEEETEVSAEAATEAEETGAETTDDNESGNQTAEAADGETNAQQSQSGETFTLKVNKEEKTYSREEIIGLAQKGVDYDRVKAQLTQSRQNAETLQGMLSDQKEAMTVLGELAKASNVEVPALLRDLRLSLLKKQGLSDDAANERLLRLDAERENAVLKAVVSAKAPETGKQRAQRELAEFREVYPEVQLTQDVLDQLMKDVQGGMTLTRAYQKNEAAKKDAQIAELQRQLAAEKQNKENLAASPGSQKDSGGKRTKSDYDDFLEAFE